MTKSIQRLTLLLLVVSIPATSVVADLTVELRSPDDFSQFSPTPPDCRSSEPRSCRGLVLVDPDGDPLNGQYVGFSVTNNDTAPYEDLWVRISGFGAASPTVGQPCSLGPDCFGSPGEFCNPAGICEPPVRLADQEVDDFGLPLPEQSGTYRIGPLAPGETAPAFFYLHVGAPPADPPAQVTPVLTVHEQHPDFGIQLPLNSGLALCTTPEDTQVCKVDPEGREVQFPLLWTDTVGSSAPSTVFHLDLIDGPRVGGKFEVTVVGETGLLGGVADYTRDGQDDALSVLAAAVSEDWPANSFELRAVSVRHSGQTDCFDAAPCDAYNRLTVADDYLDCPAHAPCPAPPLCEDQIVDQDAACVSDIDCLPWQWCDDLTGTCFTGTFDSQTCVVHEEDQHLDLILEPNQPYEYVARYVFRITGEVGGGPCLADPDCGPGQACLDPGPSGTCVTPVAPVTYFSSGEQIKHGPTPDPLSLYVPATVNVMTVAKSVEPSVLPKAGGVSTFSVSVTNPDASDLEIDEILDGLPENPAVASYVPGSATIQVGGQPPEPIEPFLDPATNRLIFNGPIAVPAGGSTVVSYDVLIPGVEGTYVNQAIARVGPSQLDTTATTFDDSPATAGVVVNAAPTEVSISGDLRAEAGTGTDVVVHFTPACNAVHNTGYLGESVGPMTAISWTRAFCQLSTTSPVVFDPGDPPPGSFYYFVLVANDGNVEGPYGLTSAGPERTEAAGLECDYPQDLSGSCP